MYAFGAAEAAEFADELAAGTELRGQILGKRRLLLCVDPVENGVGEDDVRRFLQRERRRIAFFKA